MITVQPGSSGAAIGEWILSISFPAPGISKHVPFSLGYAAVAGLAFSLPLMLIGASMENVKQLYEIEIVPHSYNRATICAR